MYGNRPAWGLYIGDPERERALLMVREAYVNWELDDAEFKERVDQILAARRLPQLAVALRDLPVPQVPQSRAPTRSTILTWTYLVLLWGFVLGFVLYVVLYTILT